MLPRGNESTHTAHTPQFGDAHRRPRACKRTTRSPVNGAGTAARS